jgi:hypothetical protein
MSEPDVNNETRSLDAADAQAPQLEDRFLADIRAMTAALLNDPTVSKLPESQLRTLSTVLLERMLFARQAGITFHGHRDLYEILGYNRLLTYREFRARYLRGGIAKRIVDAYPTAVWRAGARVFEDEDPKTETPFEKSWKDFERRVGAWSRFERVHKLASLSTYAVLLIGAAGDLSTELPRGNGTPDGIMYLQPFSGGGGPGGGDNQDNRSRAMVADATIMEFDRDPASPRFGLPLTYWLKRTSVSSPLLARPVHWTRVLHVAEGLLGDEIYGTPALEAVWNLIDDLDKVIGGGAEAFWLRANAGMHVDVDKEMGMPTRMPGVGGAPGVTRSERDALREQAENLQHQLQRVMVTRGVNVTQLSSPVANFKDPADAIITQIAGTKAIPKRILVGSEMGQLASGQDKDNWNTQVQDRRTSWAFPGLVKPFIDRLIEYNYLPMPKQFDVEWPVIEDLTEDEKVKLSLDMANVNKAQEAVVFTEDEIRAVRFRDNPLSAQDQADDMSETMRADIALKLTQANKAMGLTVFTDDEIRKITYKFEPLPDSEKVPIGAPEKISVTAPPKIGDEEGEPAEQAGQAPGTGKVDETTLGEPPLAAAMRELEAAVYANDLTAIGRILGIGARRVKTLWRRRRAA